MAAPKPVLRTLAVWLVLMAAETIHGTLRVLFLEPSAGELRAKQVGVFTGCLLILGLTYLFIEWLRVERTRSLLLVGVAWVVLTLLFEVGIGRLAFRYSWDVLAGRFAADYNLLRGGLMPLGLLVLASAPLLAARLRGIGTRPPGPARG